MGSLLLNFDYWVWGDLLDLRMSSKPRTRSRAAAAAAASPAETNVEANTAAVPPEEPRQLRKKRQPAAAPMEFFLDFVDDEPDE